MKTNLYFKSLVLIFCLGVLGYAQNPSPTPTPTPNVVGEVTVTAANANTDPVYTKFRKLSETPDAFSGEYVTVNNLVLQRDAATFTLHSGEIYFLTAAEGKTTGAVFFGDGEMALTPPVASEKKMLKFFTDAQDFKEQFSQLVIFFTDETFEEIKKSPNAKVSSRGAQASRARSTFRDKESLLQNKFHYNITARLLMDIYSYIPRPGFFTCFIEGKKNSKLAYEIDPLGITTVAPEQVMLLDYSDTGSGILAAFHMANEYKKGTATNSIDRRIYDETSHNIEVTVRGMRLFVTDKITLSMIVPGQRVLPFDLYPTLKVKRVSGENSEEVSIIQESKDKDGSLSVVLPSAPKVGKPFTLNFEYEGEDVLQSLGTGNFILNPGARSVWYPNNPMTAFGDRANFDITIRYPKQYAMIGVGELAEPEKTEGDLKVAHWISNGVEMAVGGFNYGDFIKKEVNDQASGYGVEVYVNREIPDELKAFQQNVERAETAGVDTFTTVGSMTTSSLAQTVLGESQNALRIYNTFFGKMPFKRIAISQQPAGFFGQSWGSLVYMPYFAFINETQRVQIFGARNGKSTFWREVGAHEIAHQWWGHAVAWTSYHDQWMSEGFAEFSTSLYIQYVKKDLNKFNEFWEDQRHRIVEASPQTKGLKPYTVGPITEGFRLSTGKTGNIYFNLIYPKGAYILHMIRMMMYDSKTGDARFSKMMKDFLASHYNKDVSTEDFKSIVEKHITPEMNIDKNGKMDWFFDEWVYGTDVPAYKLEYSVAKSGDKGTLNAKITQSGVSDNFVMPVPIYVDLGEGFVSLGTVTLVGNQTFDLNEVQLPKVPKKVTIAALNDVLATQIEVVKK